MSIDAIGSVGTLVYTRGADAWIRPADLQAVLDRHGYALRAPVLDPVRRAADCARGWTATRRLSTDPEARTRVEVLDATADRLEVGILWREAVASGPGGEVRWVQRDRVVYDRAAGWSTPGTPEGEAWVAEAARWQDHTDYRWIRDRWILPEVARMGGFLIAPQGGVYFVAATHRSRLARLADAAREAGVKVGRVRVGPDPESLASVGEAAEVHLDDTLRDVLGRIAEWRARDVHRAPTGERYLTELAELREQAIGLRGLLGVPLAALEAAIVDAEGAVLDELHRLASGEPVASSESVA